MKAGILSSLLVLVMMTGCNPSIETAATQQPTQAPAPAEQKTAGNVAVQNTNLPEAGKWRSYFADREKKDIVSLFERAQKLVADKKGVQGKINVWSSYFGQWFIVVIDQDRGNAPIATDEDVPVERAYLVDMASEEVIDTGDWRAAKPFVDALMATFKGGFDDADDRKMFLYKLASAASVIGFGHTRYIEDAENGVHYPTPVTGPKFKMGMNQSELVYYVRSNSMAQMYTKCVMTVTRNAIVFNSEIVMPE